MNCASNKSIHTRSLSAPNRSLPSAKRVAVDAVADAVGSSFAPRAVAKRPKRFVRIGRRGIPFLRLNIAIGMTTTTHQKFS